MLRPKFEVGRKAQKKTKPEVFDFKKSNNFFGWWFQHGFYSWLWLLFSKIIFQRDYIFIFSSLVLEDFPFDELFFRFGMGNLWWLWFEGCKTKPFGVDDQCILGFQALKWMKFRHLDLSQGKKSAILDTVTELILFAGNATKKAVPPAPKSKAAAKARSNASAWGSRWTEGRARWKRRALLWGGTAVKSSDMKWCEKWWSYSILTLTSETFFVFGTLLTLFLHFPCFVADFQVWVSQRSGFFFRIPTLSRCVYMFQLNQTCNQGGIFSTAGGGAFRPRSGRSLLCCPWLIKTLELLGFPMSWFRISKKISLKPRVFRK